MRLQRIDNVKLLVVRFYHVLLIYHFVLYVHIYIYIYEKNLVVSGTQDFMFYALIRAKGLKKADYYG